jgi:hypothetical protein
MNKNVQSAIPDAALLAWFGEKMQIETQKIVSQIKEDRAFVKDTIGNAIKIGGGLVAIAIGLLTFVGIQHLSDIKPQIESEVRQRFADFNPQEIYKKDIQSLTDRAMISTYKIEFAERKSNLQESKISTSDTKRIIEIISDQNSEYSIFLAAAELLYSRTHDGDSRAVDKAITRLVSAEGDAAWVKGSADRWAEIIRLARNRKMVDLKPIIRKMISDATLSDDLRTEAIDFAAALSDGDALPSLKELQSSQNGQIQTEALYAIAAIAPASDVVQGWLTKVRTSAKDLETLATALTIAGRVLVVRNSGELDFLDSDKHDAENDLAAILISEAIDGGCSFSLRGDVFLTSSYEQDANPGVETTLHCKDMSTGYIIPNILVLGEPGPIQKVLATASRESTSDQLTKVIDAFSQESGGSQQVRFRVAVDVQSTASIDIDKFGTLDQEKTSFPVVLSVKQNGSSREVNAAWIDVDGLPRKGVVKSIKNPESAGFRLMRVDRMFEEQ